MAVQGRFALSQGGELADPLPSPAGRGAEVEDSPSSAKCPWWRCLRCHNGHFVRGAAENIRERTARRRPGSERPPGYAGSELCVPSQNGSPPVRLQPQSQTFFVSDSDSFIGVNAVP